MAKNEKSDRFNIFKYRNYRELLKDLFEYKKKCNPDYSYRQFAKKAGFSSPVFLKLVIESKRNLTDKSILKIAKGFGLNFEETDFFENLVLMNQTNEPEKKDYYYRKLLHFDESVKPANIKHKQFDFFSHWYHLVIREIVCWRNENITPKQIAQKLNPEISIKEIKNSLKLLTSLGLLEKTKTGQYRQTETFLRTKPEVESILISRFHKQMIELAIQSLIQGEPDKREISSLTLTIHDKDLPIIKGKIQKLQKELLKLSDSTEKPNSVYQVNFQAFPLTK